MLTADQQKQRQGRLTGSRIAPLMTGDAERIMRLYRIMIGEEPEEDLSHNFQVRLGEVTEDLQLDWYEEQNQRLLTLRRAFVTHPERDWAGATLDGFDPLLGCSIECKHVGGHEPMELIIERYQPQLHWQMFVTRTDQCALSVIMGTNAPVVTYIPRDWDYLNIMIKRAERFMYHVGMRTPPLKIAPAVEPPAWDTLAKRDMTGNNLFGVNADTWLATKRSHREHEDAKDVLKSLITEHDREIFGHGVRVVRDRANRLHVREIKEKE